MRFRGRRGFTLIELLVVIAIIGILVAMLSQGLAATFRTMGQVRCASNLNTLWEAYGVRASQERQGQAGPLRAGSWVPALMPYLEEQASVLVCGEDTVAMNPDSEEAKKKKCHPRNLRVYSDPMGSSPSGPPLPPHWMSWEDVDVSKEGSRGASVLVKNVVPNRSYELWFEDSWRNNTWNDLILRIEPLDDGSLKVTYVGQHTGAYHYWLCDAETNEFLLPTVYPNQWMGHKATVAVGTVEIIDMTGGTGAVTSYGMNSLTQGEGSLSRPGRVILLMDYARAVAKGPTDAYPDNWKGKDWESEDGSLLFARHFGMVNVLYSDGSVELAEPRAFDPFDYQRSWPFWDVIEKR